MDPRLPDWQKILAKPQHIKIDHPLDRHAPKISICLGATSTTAIFLFAETPWWVPIFIGAVIAVMVNRILRPRTRGFQIEDEI